MRTARLRVGDRRVERLDRRASTGGCRASTSPRRPAAAASSRPSTPRRDLDRRRPRRRRRRAAPPGPRRTTPAPSPPTGARASATRPTASRASACRGSRHVVPTCSRNSPSLCWVVRPQAESAKAVGLLRATSGHLSIEPRRSSSSAGHRRRARGETTGRATWRSDTDRATRRGARPSPRLGTGAMSDERRLDERTRRRPTNGER